MLVECERGGCWYGTCAVRAGAQALQQAQAGNVNVHLRGGAVAALRAAAAGSTLGLSRRGPQLRTGKRAYVQATPHIVSGARAHK